jgi:hypothetical protein
LPRRASNRPKTRKTPTCINRDSQGCQTTECKHQAKLRVAHSKSKKNFLLSQISSHRKITVNLNGKLSKGGLSTANKILMYLPRTKNKTPSQTRAHLSRTKQGQRRSTKGTRTHLTTKRGFIKTRSLR